MTIRSPWLKALFVVCAVVLAWTIGTRVFGGLPDYALQPLNAAITVALFACGVRTFRGKDESPKRPFWRATAGPRWGIFVAATCVLLMIGGVASAFPRQPLDSIVPILVWGGIAAFYIQSSVRLAHASKRPVVGD